MSRSRLKLLKAAMVATLIISLLSGMALYKGLAADCAENSWDCIEDYGSSPSAPGRTAENPIIIDSVDDLEAFAEDLRDGETYAGNFLALKADILIDKHNKVFVENLLSCSAVFGGKFEGILDGEGHTITIDIKSAKFGVSDSGNFLFNSLNDGAVVKNLYVSGALDRIAPADSKGKVEDSFFSRLEAA